MADPLPPRSFDDPARQAAALLIRLGIAVLAIGVPSGSLISRRLIFTVMPVGAALILLGVLLDPKRAHVQRFTAALSSPLFLTTLFLLGWGMLSLAWTPFTAIAGERYFKTAGTLLFAMLTAAALPAHSKTSNLYLLPIGLGIGALATLVIAIVAPPSVAQDIEASTLDRISLTLCMMLWPALAALAVRNRWMSAGLLAVAVAVAIIAVWMPTALGALAAGAIVFSVSNSSQMKIGRGIGIALAILILLAPALPFALAPLLRSSTGAFAISMQTAEALFSAEGLRLLTGHGYDTVARGFQIGYLPSAMPRSAIFEIWYELGIIGAASLAAVVFLAFHATAQLPKPLTGFLQGALVCGSVIGLSGLVTAQIWWITILSVVGILFALVAKGQYRTERPSAKNISANALRPQI
jgi:hypothetical protein